MTFLMTLLQQDDGSGGGMGGSLFGLIVFVLVIAGLWKVFTKAGQPGWAAIIPIYNFYILTKIAGKPAWWVILMLIPVINIIPWVSIAKSFGKGAGFGLGLTFLSPIFVPILGFGGATYQGPSA